MEKSNRVVGMLEFKKIKYGSYWFLYGHMGFDPVKIFTVNEEFCRKWKCKHLMYRPASKITLKTTIPAAPTISSHSQQHDKRFHNKNKTQRLIPLRKGKSITAAKRTTCKSSVKAMLRSYAPISRNKSSTYRFKAQKY